MAQPGPGRGRGRDWSAVLLGSVLLVAAAAAEGPVEVLLPGQVEEREIAAGETHAHRVVLADGPLLLAVDQRGVDLAVEARGPTGAISTDTGEDRWGLEVLLLEGAGDHRVEVRRAAEAAGSGRYEIRVEILPAAEPDRIAAVAAMSRAGRESAARSSEGSARAREAFREALALWRARGDRRWEAEALTAVAALEQETGDRRAALADFLAAATQWRELAEPAREAATLNRLGVTRLQAGESQAAREALEASLALWQRLGEPFDEAETRSNLCGVEQNAGLPAAALGCFEESLGLFRASGARIEEARTLNNLGGVYDLLGEPDAALDHYGRALVLRRALGDRRLEAETLNNIAVVHRALGEWGEALRIYGQQRTALQAIGDRYLEGSLLNNLGFAYNSLGRPERARALLEEALTVRRETAERRGEVITLNNLGVAWRNLGDPERATTHHREALARAVALGDRRQEAVSRLRLAEAGLEGGDAAAALAELQPALAYFQTTGNRRSELAALGLAGRALTVAGRPGDALPLLARTLDISRTLRDRAAEAETLRATAVAERSLGRPDEARAHAEEAVAVVEALRTGFVGPDLRASFLATQREVYALVVDLLMRRAAADPAGGHEGAALAASERGRARSLLDALYTGGRSTGAPPSELVERRRALRRRLAAKSSQQTRQGGAVADALGREVELLLTELDGVESEIRRHDPRSAAVGEPPRMGPEEVADLLDPGTLLLEYALGEPRSFVWAVGDGSFRSHVLPPGREVEALARRAYEELSTVETGAGGRRPAAVEALAAVLLRPVWSEVTDAERVVVVPDGALHLVPFGALAVPVAGGRWDDAGGREPLLEGREVASIPSATTLALARRRLAGRPAAPQRAVVFADPVFAADDPRVAPDAGSLAAGEAVARRAAATDEGLWGRFERLPASRREAAAIAAASADGGVSTVLDLEASREAALADTLAGYRVVHFATHGIADARNPELSGLALSMVDGAGRSREGFLGLSDVYELDLAADLVVLSGCRTALGREVRGEGLMGLTRGFLYAGVPRVVASLWRVEDRASAELMTRFYAAMWRRGLPPAAALREAQRALRRDPRYRAPYSWAAFVLQGEWR